MSSSAPLTLATKTKGFLGNELRLIRRRINKSRVVRLARILVGRGRGEGLSVVNLLARFPAFAPSSFGSYGALGRITIQSINETPTALSAMVPDAVLPGMRLVLSPNANSYQIGELLDHYGSDKASRHGYHLVYGDLIPDPRKIRKVLEIGIGSRDSDIVSSMRIPGEPGGSLRAFRDWCPNAQVFGADLDRAALVEEERIQSFVVDQTCEESLAALASKIGTGFDIMIDDGLHAPHSNLRSLKMFLPLLHPGGVAIIEDIAPAAEDLWKICAGLLARDFHCELIHARERLVFVVRKTARE